MAAGAAKNLQEIPFEAGTNSRGIVATIAAVLPPARPAPKRSKTHTACRSRSSAGNGARNVCAASHGSSPPLA